MPSAPQVRFGMTFCPGKVQTYALTGSWSRDLDQDLLRIRDEFSVRRLICCIESHEMRSLGVTALFQRCSELGLDLIQLPIPDGGVPNAQILAEFTRQQQFLLNSTEESGFTATFCKGGLGRTGLITACLLKTLGLDTKQAIELVRKARAGAIETVAQEQFVDSF